MEHIYGYDIRQKRKNIPVDNRNDLKKLIPYKIRFKLQDMNDPDNLKQFLRFLGLPSQPFSEIEEELALSYLRQFLIKFKMDKKRLESDYRH